MTVSDFYNKMKSIQDDIIEYINDDENLESCFQKFISKCYLFNIQNNKYEMTTLLNLILNISNNHHHTQNFYEKIIKLILYHKNQIEKDFSDFDIFNIFRSNKKVILHLIEANFIKIIDPIAQEIEKDGNSLYFIDKIQDRLTHSRANYNLSQIPEDFDEKRRNEFNENCIYGMIKNDSIDEFIIYVNQTNLDLSTKIKISTFETNLYLIGKEPTLIEIAAFYGSIQIIKYLLNNNVELNPTLWPFVIHSNNCEIFYLLEENKVEFDEQMMKQCFKEAIKCHHNDIANYIQNMVDDKSNICNESFRFCNFHFINLYDLSFDAFENFIKYGYSIDVDIITKNNDLFHNLMNLLSLAIYYNNLEIVKLLLSNFEIDINMPIKWPSGSVIKRASLIYAIQNKKVDIIKYLVSLKNTNVNVKYYDFKFGDLSALNCAISTKNIEIVKLLLEREDIDVNVMDRRYEPVNNGYIGYYYYVCPLYNSILNKNIDILKLLISHKNIKLDVKISRRMNDYIKDRFKYYRLYLTSGYEMYYRTTFTDNSFREEKSIFYSAVELGHFEIVEYLLSIPEIDKTSNYIFDLYHKKEKIIKNAFDFAFENNYFDIFQLLLKNGDSSIIQSSQTPFLAISTYKNMIPLVENILLCNNINKNLHYEGQSALHIATERDDIDLIKLLLSHDNIDINDPNSKNETALHIAVRRQNMEIIKLLLSYDNIDFNSRCDNKTALHLAIENQNMEIIDYLLSLDNIDVSVSKYEKPPIIIATENNNINIVQKLLLNKDLDINSRYDLKTALHIAVENQNLEMVQLLMTKDNLDLTVVKGEKPPLIIAVENDNIKIVDLLVSRNDLDVNSVYSYAKKSNIDNIIYQVEKNALYISVEKKNIDMVNALLKSDNHIVDFKFRYFNDRKNYFEYKKSPLDLAKYICHKGITELLENYMKNHNNEMLTHAMPQIIIEVLNENIPKVQELCQSKDIDVNVVFNKKTPLIISTEKENIEIIKLLLSRDDIDVNYRYENKTALHIAVEKQNLEIIELLMTKDNLDLTVVEGEKPPLIIAVENDNIKIVDLLVSRNDLDVNSTYKYHKNQVNKLIEYEKTALFISVEKKNVEIVRSLLKKNNHKTDLKFRFYNHKNLFLGSKTPLMLAKDICNHKEIIELLENYEKAKKSK